jgi:hypothetical protein
MYFMANWYMLKSFDVFYGQLVYFMAMWYILLSSGIFFPFGYLSCNKKKLATLVGSTMCFY